MREFMLVLSCCFLTLSSSLTTASTDCPEMCGSIHVPYPFGIRNASSASIGNPKCALRKAFMLECNFTRSPPQLYFGNKLEIRNISVEEGTLSINTYASYECYNGTALTGSHDFWMQLGNDSYPFWFSHTRNKLTTVGCDTYAFISDAQGSVSSVCISLCSDNQILEGSCSGIGCCQTAIPKNLKTMNVTVGSLSNHSAIWQFNPCGYAFLADERSFNVSDLQLSYQPFTDSSRPYATSEIVIDWVAREQTCDQAQSQQNLTEYACGNNADCLDSENGIGYRCLCKRGFTGNPYLRQGCQDINECNQPQTYPCGGTCKNTVGNYTCRCPLGMHGDGKIGCQGFGITTVATVIGVILLALIIIVLMVITWNKRTKERNFIQNGGKFLKRQRVRIFGEAELAKATKNYDTSQLLGEGGFGFVFRGVLEDQTLVAIKKPKDLDNKPKDSDKAHTNQTLENEIEAVLQVNHINVVKIIGLCLETKVPLLVYEFISNGSLYDHIHRKRSQILGNWKIRLKIASETALALDYLHSLANPPIIHGDVKSANILLDENYTAKVADFGASVLVSPGQTNIATKIQGTLGYLDPDYLMTGNLTEKSDVYSFGVVLVELLTGEKPNSNARSGEKRNVVQYFLSSLESKNISEILCFMVTEEEIEEIQEFAQVAKRCVSSIGVKRPTMKQVAEELGKLRKLNESLCGQQNSQETEHLLGDDPSYHSITTQPDTLSTTTFSIDLYPPDSV